MPVTTLSDLVFRIRETSSGRADLLSFSSGERREALSTVDFLRGIHSLALALETRRLARGDRVAIFSENRPEWHIVDFACQLLGVQSVLLPAELPKQQVGYILRNSGCRWIFYDTEDRRDLLLSLQSTLTSPPELAAFVANAAAAHGVTITRLMGEGAARQAATPIERFRGLVEQHDPASLIYHCATSGDPERISLSHYDLITRATERAREIELSPSDHAVACLPLAQDLQRTIDLLCFVRGVAIHYPSSNEIPLALSRERPSVVTAPPEVYEQLFQREEDRVQLENPLRRRLFRWAVETGVDGEKAGEDTVTGPLQLLRHKIVPRFVLRRFYRQLGGRLRLVICEPPLRDDIRRVFEVLGLAVIPHEPIEKQSPVNLISEPPP